MTDTETILALKADNERLRKFLEQLTKIHNGYSARVLAYRALEPSPPPEVGGILRFIKAATALAKLGLDADDIWSEHVDLVEAYTAECELLERLGDEDV